MRDGLAMVQCKVLCVVTSGAREEGLLWVSPVVKVYFSVVVLLSQKTLFFFFYSRE